VAPTIQTCAVVAAQHQCWWDIALGSLERPNIFIQPENKGTAHGVLLGLLHLEARDPDATVLMLPADHHIRHEDIFARSLRQVCELAADSTDTVFLLGAEPDRPDSELGYIVPAVKSRSKPARVLSFVEKPDAARLQPLLRAGALQNMFIIAGAVGALRNLYQTSFEPSMTGMRQAIGRAAPFALDAPRLAAVYQHLPNADFSRDILEPQTARLKVLRVPACGWNDLGTPKRVLQTLQQLETRIIEPPQLRPLNSAILSLADQCRRLVGPPDTGCQ